MSATTNPAVIELFSYLGVTAVVMFLVRQMSPYRPMSWPAGVRRVIR